MIKSPLAILLLDIISLSSHVAGQAVQKVRLVGGAESWKGRVEIYHDGQWGTVCDDAFGVEEARVVCRQLGYNDIGQAHSMSNEDFEAGTGDILLDQLQCEGEEESLVNCSHNGIGAHDCDHSEDASVSCGKNGGNGCLTSTPCSRALGCIDDAVGTEQITDIVCPVCVCTDFSNVALNKPATQSTIFHHAIEVDPQRVVDGNRNSDTIYCTHTAMPDTNPNRWWRVDLESDFVVQGVVVTNRAQGYGYRLANFDITVSQNVFDPFSGYPTNVRCAHHSGAVGEGATVRLPCNQEMVGRYVTLILPTTTEPLNLCELEVMAPGCPAEPTCPQTCERGRREIYDVNYLNCRMCRCLPQDVSETEKPSADSSSMGPVIAMSTLMAGLLIVLIVLAIYLWKLKMRKRKRRMKKVAPISMKQNNWFPAIY